jgi:hypothetical protein
MDLPSMTTVVFRSVVPHACSLLAEIGSSPLACLTLLSGALSGDGGTDSKDLVLLRGGNATVHVGFVPFISRVPYASN